MTDIFPLIVDDEKNGRLVLKTLLGRILGENAPIETASSVTIALKILENSRVNVIFLDINMPNQNGFELLDQLDTSKYHVVFVTAHKEFALKAFSYSALHYLLKPISEESLEEAVDRIKQSENPIDFSALQSSEAQNNPFNISVLNEENVLEILELGDVEYIEANGPKSVLSMKDGAKKHSTKTLKHYDEILSSQHFVRIHYSYLLNLKYLSGIDNEDLKVILKSGRSLPVAVRRKRFLKNALKAFSI